jgi:hypothetical protein
MNTEEQRMAEERERKMKSARKRAYIDVKSGKEIALIRVHPYGNSVWRYRDGYLIDVMTLLLRTGIWATMNTN